MADIKRKVPNLRFKGFTDDWEQRKLGEISERILRKNSDLQSLLPLTISAQDGLVDQTIYFNKQVASKQLKNYLLLYNGDFAYNKSYSVGYPYGAIKRLDKYKQGVLSTLYIAFKPTNINSDFLQHYYDTDKWYREIYRNAAEGARNHGLLNISANDFFNSKLITPSDNDEQLKIAKIINVFNRLITLQQRKLDLLKQLKKGLLQKMFADKDSKRPVLQFKIFHDDWEQRKLGDLIKEFSIKSKIEDEYKVLSSTNSGMKFREGRVTGTSNLGYKIIKNGDLVLSPQNLWLGNININNIGKGLVSPSYKTFKLINIDSSFINPQLRTQKMLEEYKNSSTQGASVVRRNLEIDSFYQIKIFVPTISEQEKIGSFFQRLDNTIVLQHQKLAKCQSVKKSLLQQMFI